MYVYIKSEVALWTVGFYAPNGNWEAESDYDSQEAAAKRVHYLNGGCEAIDLDCNFAALKKALESLVAFVHDLQDHWPEAKTDDRTAECVGGIFATLPIAERALQKVGAL